MGEPLTDPDATMRKQPTGEYAAVYLGKPFAGETVEIAVSKADPDAVDWEHIADVIASTDPEEIPEPALSAMTATATQLEMEGRDG